MLVFWLDWHGFYSAFFGFAIITKAARNGLLACSLSGLSFAFGLVPTFLLYATLLLRDAIGGA